MVEQRQAQAFKTEFYDSASEDQIKDDLVSYLGEYRFKFSEFDYKLGFLNGKLVDPNSHELMTAKANKAITTKINEGLNFSREKAELMGIFSLEDQLLKNPSGTVVWFSPPGLREDGYGDYGFGYVGKLNGSVLEMTAIRLEDPQINDFNKATNALWENEYKTAEDFLETPKVINIEKEKVTEYIYGNFEINKKNSKDKDQKIVKQLMPAIIDCVSIIKNGDSQSIHIAMHTLENLSIELNSKITTELPASIVYLSKQILPDFKIAMTMPEYIKSPTGVYGSCGLSGKKESNNIFRNLDKKVTKITKERDFDFDQSGPCRLCGKDAPCGPCKICESCNDKIDINEIAYQSN